MSDLERKRATERMQEKMAALFRVQGRSVIKEFVRFKRHFVEAGLNSSIDSMLDDALSATIPTMTKDFTATGLQGYKWGYADLAENLDLQDAFSLEHPRAVEWANKNAATRVAGVNNTTKKDIRNLISYGLEEGESYGEVQRSIKNQFKRFAVGSPLEHIQSRAELVAVTEMGNAYEAGAATLSDELESYGIEQEKARSGPNDDRTSDACRADLGAGWIPKNQAFPSGLMSGLEHPGCRHGTIYRVSRREAPEGPPSVVAKAKAAKKAKTTIPRIPKPPKVAKAVKPPKPITPEQWAEGLATEESKVVGYWQSSAYTEIRAFEKGLKPGHISVARARKLSKSLNSTLDKAPQYKGTVYRGIHSLDDDIAKAMINSKELSFDALSSATTDKGIASVFAERGKTGQSILLEIKTKTGVEINGASLKSFTSEKEVILRKGTRYKVVKAESLGTTEEYKLHLTKLILEEI